MTLQQKIYHTKRIADSIQRGETTYTYDEASAIFLTVPLPTPQRCGTMTQQRTYAMGKAMDIVEGLER